MYQGCLSCTDLVQGFLAVRLSSAAKQGGKKYAIFPYSTSIVKAAFLSPIQPKPIAAVTPETA
jgi:hypothetical protein